MPNIESIESSEEENDKLPVNEDSNANSEVPNVPLTVSTTKENPDTKQETKANQIKNTSKQRKIEDKEKLTKKFVNVVEVLKNRDKVAKETFSLGKSNIKPEITTTNGLTNKKQPKGPNLKKRTAESSEEAVKSMRFSYFCNEGPKALQKSSPVNKSKNQ